MASVSTVESLILKVTNPLMKEEDPNIIHSVCQAVSNEEGGIKTALRLIIHKTHSPQEKEALQALLILQSCVNNCGSAFQAEIGKFRFLNELIKLVSPNYLGNQTTLTVKRRVVELLYAWSQDLPNEPKINEAYQMLKEQNIIKEDPKYIGMPASKSFQKTKPAATFDDEEKSRVLQRLLQSKRPDDVLKANALIKHMVKEDERRLERSSRRIIEVETALNNVSVLDEMLSQYERTHSGNQADLDVMAELYSSCSSLQTNIYRLVSEIDDKEDGIGDILKANDELSRVMGRYKLSIEERANPETAVGSCSSNSNEKATASDEDPLLDFSSPTKESSQDNSIQHIATIDDLGMGTLILQQNSSRDLNFESSSSSSLLRSHLDNDIFSTKPHAAPAAPAAPAADLPLCPPPITSEGLLGARSAILLPDKPQPLQTTVTDPLEKPKKYFEDLDTLGTNLLKQSLPENVIPVGPQFKPQEKVSLNELRILPPSYPAPSPPSASDISASRLTESTTMLHRSHQMNGGNRQAVLSDGFLGSGVLSDGFLGSGDSSTVGLLDDSSNEVYPERKSNFVVGGSVATNRPTAPSDNITSVSDIVLLDVLPNKDEESDDHLFMEGRSDATAVSENMKKTSLPNSIQLSEVKPLTNIYVPLENIKPGQQSCLNLSSVSNGVSLTLHFAENRPRDDVSVLVATATSQNPKPISNYVLQAVVPKGCKVRLLKPSASELQGFSPFLPPPAITQVMLIANPNQLNVSLKAMLSYTVGDDNDPVTDMVEIDTLPL